MNMDLNTLITQRDIQIRNMGHLRLAMGLLEAEIGRLGESTLLAQPVIEALEYIGNMYDEMSQDLRELNRMIGQ